jgi:hypothetical protein
VTRARTDLEEMTGGWFPDLPRAYEKSVVLGGGLVLFPCPDPQATSEILSKYAAELAKRAYRAGRAAAKEEIRKAIFE